jgi:hypothetical protein
MNHWQGPASPKTWYLSTLHNECVPNCVIITSKHSYCPPIHLWPNQLSQNCWYNQNCTWSTIIPVG